MLLDDYQRRARQTAIYPDQGHNLGYPALGLGGENGEIAEKLIGLALGQPLTDVDALLGELGDVLWYLSQLAAEAQLQLSQLPDAQGIHAHPTLAAALQLSGCLGAVVESVKKTQRDDAGQLTEERQAQLVQQLANALAATEALAIALGSDLQQVGERNLAKLASRAQRGRLQGSGDER